ncbi:hypothetical protein N7447_005293 [Penicillium robsamsonii]|uniref:uncharacterized protein n=1 Tax=Penicillium robsamsonii TaxID=1792511 RepID=UPI0025476977|nr:uncharacterized protein N7447_005293 [Penicillium robsamsonii]KAJ5822953.1 hypothetical protein N7447_005293 [Penicillium robsamsonii]
MLTVSARSPRSKHFYAPRLQRCSSGGVGEDSDDVTGQSHHNAAHAGASHIRPPAECFIAAGFITFQLVFCQI